MARPLNGERHLAVVPATDATRLLASRMLQRVAAADIEIALVERDGLVTFVEPIKEARQR